MKRVHLVMGVLAMLLLAATVEGRAPHSADPQLAEEIRRQLATTLELWRSGDYGALYDRTSDTGRESREGFARKLAGAARHPACCWEQLQEVRVTVRSPDTATLQGRFGLEGGPAATEFSTRSLRLVLEDGIWKVARADILALAGEKRKRYRYLPTAAGGAAR